MRLTRGPARRLIFGPLYSAFGSGKDALLVYTGISPALTGGIAALAVRGMPMAFNVGTGSEVQRPLATVVIGGVVCSTVLTAPDWIVRGREAAL